MLTMNYTYRIYPDLHQSAIMLEWLETSRKVYKLCAAGIEGLD